MQCYLASKKDSMAVNLDALRSGLSISPDSPVFSQPTPTTARVPISEIQTSIQSVVGQFRYQFPADLPKYYMSLEILQYQRIALRQTATLNRLGIIYLSLPSPLVDATNVAYEERNIGPVFGTMIEQYKEWKNLKDSMYAAT